jgi:hypothetical protein
MENSYKLYQQVLNIAVKAKTKGMAPKKIAKPTPSTTTKRRTKTGCMTCRKRKKKCDEDKVHGKCQACTRNFLECCWPEEIKEEAFAKAIEIKVPVKKVEPKSPKSPIYNKCSINSIINATPHYNPYPSPVLSPVSKVKQEVDDVKYFSLDEKKPQFFIKEPQFVITSFDTKKDLCHIVS